MMFPQINLGWWNPIWPPNPRWPQKMNKYPIFQAVYMNVFNDIRGSGSDIYFVIGPAFVLITMYLVHVQSIIKSIIPGKFQDGCQNSYKFPIFQIKNESTVTPTVRLYCAFNHLFSILNRHAALAKIIKLSTFQQIPIWPPNST